MASQTAEQFYNERQARRRERLRAQQMAGVQAPAAAYRAVPASAYAAPGAQALPKPGVHALPRLSTLTPAEVRWICLILVIVTGVALAMIQLSAAAAVTQQEINDLKKNITQTEEDIVDLKVSIEQTQVIQSIRDRAESDLGMKEPEYDQYVYLADVPLPDTAFTEYIKERAYGTQEGNTEPPEAADEQAQPAE
ncbi:MAG: hypothetical protein LBR44_10400 [Clostridiales Family XIII bacterium]|jgi:cell division protein FtsL|nr:hypothetical protein [Clostridiales Family XIII bacterium]